MKFFLRTIILLSLTAVPATAARFPILGGPGLVYLQSAKTGNLWGIRSFNSFSAYSQQKFYTSTSSDDSFNDAWSYDAFSFAPLSNLSVILSGVAHGEQWKISDPDTTLTPDKTLGCPGDITVSVKYSMTLADQLLDMAVMPIVSIPMDKEKYQDSPSQTGKLDFGAKLLADINLKQTTLYVNAGFLTRGDQRPQLPVGLGFEYGFGQKFSAFAEASAELRMGAAKDSLPDSLVLSGRGYDRTEARFTPGIHYVPFDILGISLSADIGLTKAAAPWQITLGLDLPSSAGRAFSSIPAGAIAGMIKDRDTGVPMKGMITFPGAGIPGTVSDDIGKYLTELPPGDYKIHIYANGYRWLERKIVVEPGKKEKWDLTLKRKLGTVKGTVNDASTGNPINATFTFVGKDLPEFNSNPSSGEYNNQAPPGKYSLSVTANGYQTETLEVTIKDRQEAVNDIYLKPLSATVASNNAPRRKTVQAEKPVSSQPAAPKATQTVKPAAASTPKKAAPAKLSADEINALYKTGVKQYMNEEYDKAIQTFQKLLKSDPGNAKAKDYLSKAKDRLKKIKG